MRWWILAAAVPCMLASTAVSGWTAVPALRGIAIEQRLDADSIPPDLPAALPLIVRLSIDESQFTGTADESFARLRARLELYKSRNIQVVLSLPRFPANDDNVERWRQLTRAVADRSRDLVLAIQVGEVSANALPDVARYAYLLKLAAVQIRSVDPKLLVIEGPIPVTAADWQGGLFAAGTGPYTDGLAVSGPDAEPNEPFRAAVERMTSLVERTQPSMMMLLGPTALPAAREAAISRLIDTEMRALGSRVQVRAYTGDTSAVAAALGAAARLADVVGGDLVALDERAARLRLLQGDSDVTAGTSHRLLYSLTNFATYFVYSGTGSPVDLDITIANASMPMLRDPIAGAASPAVISAAPGSGSMRVRLPATDRPLLLDFNFGAPNVYTQASEVTTENLPRVEEIIFRHQQVQAAQDAVLQNYIAHVRIEQHFHPSPADPAYNLVTENRLFSDKSGVEWEELSFELNGAKWTSNRPAFPLVQPEKVLSLPLDLHLNQDYAYRLEGVDVVDEHPVYVVRFDPIDSTRQLYRGTVWIDRRTFARVKVQAVETHLSGLVVSNDETQQYSLAGEVQGRSVWLMDRLSSRQIFLIAGRNVLVEREVRLSNLSLNVSEFDAERAGARASNRVMYRDTDTGIRYLVKRGDSRVVSDQLTTSARAFALGADIDPSFDFPLPIGGLNILDFNFLDRNMQLALLFGGVIALGNIQRPSLWGGKFDVSVDFFGLALKANNDVFDSAGKRAGERVNRIPASTGVNVGYQVSPFHKITGHYELKYDAYFRDAETAADFAIPSSTATSGEGIGYEYRQRGYSLIANAATYRRSTWEAWGFDAAPSPTARTYTKYDLGLSKDFVFATFHTIHLNGGYFGGQRLDRFSMYEFGLFDSTRMHGVPSSVRLAELGMFRGSYSFNVFDQYRFDLFFDHAVGRDVSGGGWRQITGTGVRLNLRAPRSTILQLDLGKSFLPEAYRGAGSTVVQVLLLKPL